MLKLKTPSNNLSKISPQQTWRSYAPNPTSIPNRPLWDIDNPYQRRLQPESRPSKPAMHSGSQQNSTRGRVEMWRGGLGLA